VIFGHGTRRATGAEMIFGSRNQQGHDTQEQIPIVEEDR
jgi:hypothetical protein